MHRTPIAVIGSIALLASSPAHAETSVSDEFGLDVTFPANQARVTGVAFAGTQYGIVWQYTRTVGDASIASTCFGFSRIDLSGTPLQSTGIEIGCHTPPAPPTASTTTFGDIAFDGTNYVVFWSARDGSETTITGTRIDTSGNVLGAVSIDDLPRSRASRSFREAASFCFPIWFHPPYREPACTASC